MPSAFRPPLALSILQLGPVAFSCPRLSRPKSVMLLNVQDHVPHHSARARPSPAAAGTREVISGGLGLQLLHIKEEFL